MDKVMFNDGVVQVLTRRGYAPVCSSYDSTNQIDCYVNGTSFAFFYGTESGDNELCFDIVFEPNESVSEEQLNEFKKALNNEETLFNSCILDEFGCIHLFGEVRKADYTDEMVDSIVDTIEKEDGVVSKIKSISYVWEVK